MIVEKEQENARKANQQGVIPNRRSSARNDAEKWPTDAHSDKEKLVNPLLFPIHNSTESTLARALAKRSTHLVAFVDRRHAAHDMMNESGVDTNEKDNEHTDVHRRTTATTTERCSRSSTVEPRRWKITEQLGAVRAHGPAEVPEGFTDAFEIAGVIFGKSLERENDSHEKERATTTRLLRDDECHRRMTKDESQSLAVTMSQSLMSYYFRHASLAPANNANVLSQQAHK